MKKLNYSLLAILFLFLNFETLNSQEKKANSDSFVSRVGVVDMKRILNQSLFVWYKAKFLVVRIIDTYPHC